MGHTKIQSLEAHNQASWYQLGPLDHEAHKDDPGTVGPRIGAMLQVRIEPDDVVIELNPGPLKILLKMSKSGLHDRCLPRHLYLGFHSCSQQAALQGVSVLYASMPDSGLCDTGPTAD